MIKRLLYLGYYLKQLDREKFFRFLEHAHQESGISKARLLSDCLSSVFIYNISLLEYFQFGFYRQSKAERQSWAGTGYMYEYQRLMNPIDKRDILDDKRKFHQEYSSFFSHKVLSLEQAIAHPLALEPFLANKHGKLVLKDATGKCGTGVKIISSKEMDAQSLIAYMQREKIDLVEEFLTQHTALQEIAPSAINTVRIFTQLRSDDSVEILGCRWRIAVEGPVDNMAAGNMAAPLDEHSGEVVGPAVFSDISKPPVTHHPITGKEILGFQLPYWQEILELVKRAAQQHPQNRSIGWDVVVTPNGPGLIEGNHDWCKLVWQLPVNQGLKPILEKHQMDWLKALNN